MKFDLKDVPKSWDPKCFPSSLAVASKFPAMGAPLLYKVLSPKYR